jgi:hypothetical protein
MLSSGPTARELADLRGDRPEDIVSVFVDLRTLLYAVRDEVENVSGLTRCLLRHFAGVDEILVVPPLNPPTPLPDMAKRVEAESITKDEAMQWVLGTGTSGHR